MGWTNAPALAQAANEAVLYGSAGDGSELARSLAPVVNPAQRLSTERAPSMEQGDQLRCHAIIIDDLMLFKTVATADLHESGTPRSQKIVNDGKAEVATVCQRYLDVGARVRDEKVEDYAPRQVAAGYQLDHNTLRTPQKCYA